MIQFLDAIQPDILAGSWGPELFPRSKNTILGTVPVYFDWEQSSLGVFVTPFGLDVIRTCRGLELGELRVKFESVGTESETTGIAAGASEVSDNDDARGD
ncbi:hypothetical protein KF913_13725 [Candidatus Obscuribacterales bacterium]|nr:hypothetical protein [Candidatus Obscuribacterales bacterium]